MSEDQLISFFAYSFLIHPITSYLVSPHRKYSRWQGALYAVFFLLAISIAHIYYDQLDKAVNHYQLLNVTRGTNISVLKKAYRNLSLELHPDKNKSPDAIEEFRKVKQAFDVLSNGDMRRVYNILGDSGAKVAAQAVVDHKYIIIQMMVYYASTLVFTFLMTFSDGTGDALQSGIFGLFVMMFLESLLVLEKCSLPLFVLPYNTPYELISFCHRMYPAYINICRCLSGAFYVDQRVIRAKALRETNDTVLRSADHLREISHSFLMNLRTAQDRLGEGSEGDQDKDKGIVARVLRNAEMRGSSVGQLLSGAGERDSDGNKGLVYYWMVVQKHRSYGLFLNLAIYLVVTLSMNSFKNGAATSK